MAIRRFMTSEKYRPHGKSENKPGDLYGAMAQVDTESPAQSSVECLVFLNKSVFFAPISNLS